jgi:hypothetical protein
LATRQERRSCFWAAALVRTGRRWIGLLVGPVKRAVVDRLRWPSRSWILRMSVPASRSRRSFNGAKGVCLAMEMPFTSARHLARNVLHASPRFDSYQSQVDEFEGCHSVEQRGREKLFTASISS